MAKRKRDGESDVESMVISGGGRRREGVGELVDSHSPLPGAIKRVANQRALAKQTPKSAEESREWRQRYARYLNALAKPENLADPVKAIMEVFGLDEVTAQERHVELHDKMTAAGKGISTQELMRRYDLNTEARVMMLARHARSLDPRVSIVAIKEANDMDEQLKVGGGTTFEDWLTMMGIGS